ncbi:MAG: hypothetical protein M0Z80_12745 [Treponema sp.]|nr:hypothetical protein [Treponema sp.]
MASKAVRDMGRTDIYFGLLALGIDGWRVDWRGNTMVLSLHYHSAVLIGVDPPAIFAEAATSMAPNVKKAFELFLKRKAEDRSIYAMGFCEPDKDGFRDKRT